MEIPTPTNSPAPDSAENLKASNKSGEEEVDAETLQKAQERFFMFNTYARRIVTGFNPEFENQSKHAVQAIQAAAAFYHLVGQLSTSKIEEIKNNVNIPSKAKVLYTLSDMETEAKKYFLQWTELHNSVQYMLEVEKKKKELTKLEQEIIAEDEAEELSKLEPPKLVRTDSMVVPPV